MDKKFHMVAMDQEGNVVRDETTRESWSISELQIFFDRCKTDLYAGKVHHIAISAGDHSKIR